MMLFIEFDYETRLILFDISLFFGGIQKYNALIFFLGFLLGTYLHKLLYLVSPKDLIWIKLLFMCKEEVPHSFDRRQILINRKLFCRSRIIYKILDLAIVSFGKFLLLSFLLNPFVS